MREIAQAVGLQPTQVYRLELSKADILAEVPVLSGLNRGTMVDAIKAPKPCPLAVPDATFLRYF